MNTSRIRQILDDRKISNCCAKVLVVDDMPFNVMSLKLMLESKFFVTCDEAFSGSEGLEKVSARFQKRHTANCKTFYPLILTDINMPGMDGFQMTKKIIEFLE